MFLATSSHMYNSPRNPSSRNHRQNLALKRPNLRQNVLKRPSIFHLWRIFILLTRQYVLFVEPWVKLRQLLAPRRVLTLPWVDCLERQAHVLEIPVHAHTRTY